MRLRIVLPSALWFCAVIAPAAFAAPHIKPACDLLSQQSALAVYGSTVQPGTALTMGELMSTCTFKVGDKDGGGVALMEMIAPEHMDPNQMFQLSTHPSANARIEPVSGLGDKAAFVTDPAAGGAFSLMVISHTTFLSLIVDAPDNAARRAAMTTAVKQALAKL